MTKILVSGTPGTGKTTIAEELIKRLENFVLIDLNAFAEKTGCISGHDDERDSDIIDENKLAEEVGKLEGNYVIDGHLAHFCPGDVCIILRCNPGILRKRLELKKPEWSEDKIQENVDAEVMEIILEEAKQKHESVHVVDTSGDKESVVASILNIIEQQSHL